MKAELTVLLLRDLCQLIAEGSADHTSVYCEACALLQVLLQIFRDRVHAGFTGAEERDAGSVQLAIRLQEVAPIRPQTGSIGGDNQGSCGTGEAGKIRPALEESIDVFRLMII